MAVFWYLLMLIGWGFICLAVDGPNVREIREFVGVVGAAVFIFGVLGMRGNESPRKAKTVGLMMLLTGVVCGCWCLLETIPIPKYARDQNVNSSAGMFVMVVAFFTCGSIAIHRGGRG